MADLPDDWDKWVPVRLAFERATGFLGNAAASTIFRRLKDELIIATATTVTARNWGITSHTIPSAYWEGLTELPSFSNFWKSGDIGFNLGPTRSRGTVNYYSVRFGPNGMDDLLGVTAQPTPPIHPAASIPKEKYERKGQATEVQLRAWYAAYKTVYGGKARDTLPFAWDSALGMFPEKEVSRESVRKIMAAVDGPRVKGPKPKS